MEKIKNFIKKPIGKAVIAFAFIVIVAAVVSLFVFSTPSNDKVYSECTVEAGVVIKPEDFLKEPIAGVTFSDKCKNIDTTIPGTYEIEIVDGVNIYTSKLNVLDTIAPTGNGVTLTLGQGDNLVLDNLVTDITDATKVTLSVDEAVDTNTPGEKKINVKLTDLGGNETVVEATLIVSFVNPQIIIEAGDNIPEASEFAKSAGTTSFVTDISLIDTTHVGTHPLKVSVDGKEYDVSLKIVDTTPPVVEFKNLESFTLVNRKPEDFVASASDLTNLYYSFIEAPDINKVGEQKLKVSVKDAGGNEVSGDVTLTLKEDTDFPVITGVKDIIIAVGHNVQYKNGVTVTDECKEGLTLNVDNSKVNINQSGEYEVIYTAKDAAGHETTATCILSVRDRVYSLEEVNSMADSVIAKIIKPGMSAQDKCRAIFNYVKSHVAYISHSEKGNYIRAAYEGLADGKGDCYVYACTSKVLLTRAGVPNYDIAKIPAKTQHYWNLVDIGTGWLHFDTTPRKDHPTIFLWDDATMMAYSARHYNSHNYDHSIYPQVTGSSEGIYIPPMETLNPTPTEVNPVPNPENGEDPALAQYYAALEEQKRLEEEARRLEAEAAAQEAQRNAEILAQYQEALNQMQNAAN
ncbi:MAG: DUF5011 domain-containing protein [Lachnospiraceae bacterium]|nr:DUF5011 domain-containing protein [Lachnospiraceae bacterium]